MTEQALNQAFVDSLFTDEMKKTIRDAVWDAWAKADLAVIERDFLPRFDRESWSDVMDELTRRRLVIYNNDREKLRRLGMLEQFDSIYGSTEESQPQLEA